MKHSFGCANEGDAEIIAVLHILCTRGKMNLTADVGMIRPIFGNRDMTKHETRARPNNI